MADSKRGNTERVCNFFSLPMPIYLETSSQEIGGFEMGVGNCTDEPVDYDVDNPGGLLDDPVRIATYSSFAIGIGIGLLICGGLNPSIIAMVTGSTLILLGCLLRLRLRRRLSGTGPTPNIHSGKRTLAPGTFDGSPPSFPNGAVVRFCKSGAGGGDPQNDIARVVVNYPKCLITLLGVTEERNVGSQISVINLDRDGDDYEVQVLT